MASPAIFKERCPYCSKFKLPGEILHLSGGMSICQRCFDWHCKALEVLATGKAPDGCQDCGITFEDLSNLSADGNTRMRLVPKDGVYQILCARCSEIYLPKRMDLLGGTRFAAQKGY